MTSSILVLNSGSSSVKASLLCPSSEDIKTNKEDDEQTKKSSPPVRVMTAHADRLHTDLSVIHVTISSSAANSILSQLEDESKIGKSKASSSKLSRSDSLSLPSRSSATNDVEEKNTETTTTTTVISSDSSSAKKVTYESKIPQMSHEMAIQEILRLLRQYHERFVEIISVVGHRVVHGGTIFTDSVLVDQDVLNSIQSVSHLAPLHNPANIQGIQILQSELPQIPNVAVFDTSFHNATMSSVAYTYPLPIEYRQDPLQIRKYGFHGTSVRFVSQRATDILQLRHQTKHHSPNKKFSMVVCHLGNGASLTAVVDGKSVDTTMEFTPLTGLMMGTRSGSIDPAIVPYAAERLQKTADDVITDLNKKSGLKAISGGDSDMRNILSRCENDDADAKLAVEMFLYSLVKHIASMIVACCYTTVTETSKSSSPIDALVFTAGIGENNAYLRNRTIQLLRPILGNVTLKEEWNNANGKFSQGIVSTTNDDDSAIDAPLILVIPTDEEAMIYQDCVRLSATETI